MSTAASSRRLLAQPPSRDAVMAQAGNENFPVASYLLGPRHRRHLLAIYGFARLVDDLGDEAADDRLALLDWIEGEVDRLYAGEPVEHPLMRTLALTVSECHLPAQPFRRLIEANRRDQTVTRYETFEDLLGYCQLSAAPVGELVLHVFGAATSDRIAQSDRICAALQVTEHLQDVVEDHERGRVYVPQEDIRAFGCQDGEISRDLIAFEARRAHSLFAEGAPLAPTLRPRPRAAVASFVAGGRAALDALVDHHPRRKRPFLSGWLRAVRGR